MLTLINLRTLVACFGFTIVGAIVATHSSDARAYDLRIANKTSRMAQGQVNYAACRADSFTVAPGQTWSTNGRGLCLITSIQAVLPPVSAGQQTTPVTSYSSSGTSYSDFSITQTGTTFRVWSAAELANQTPAPATAPTGPTVKWEAVAAGSVPPAAAFKGGRQRFGGRNDASGNPVYDLLPVCRGQSNGVSAIGNAAPFYRHSGGWSWNELRCYVFLDNKELELAAYEVLIVDPQIAIRSPNAVRWESGQSGSSPIGAFDAGRSGQAMRACRAQHTDGETWVRVGTMAAAGCMFAYGGQNRLAQQYEVLVVESGASQEMVRGVNEPRLAAEPDRPTRTWQPADNCAIPNGYCRVRAKEIASLGAYKINAVVQTDANGRVLQSYKKTQGGIWEEYDTFGVVTPRVRPYIEVERNDNAITLFSGPFDFGGTNGKAQSQAITFTLRNASGEDVTSINRQWSDPQYREGYRMLSSEARMARAMRAEPDTVWGLTMKPVNAAQTTTLWKTGNLAPPLVRGPDGQFGNYRVASSGDGWLELYAVLPPSASYSKWQIHFLKVDFWRNRVWELRGTADQSPGGLDAAGLRSLARNTDPAKAWAEAYELTDAPVFSGANIGAALGRLSGSQQMAWTLREEVGGTTLRWEELKSDVVASPSNVADGLPVGRMLTEVGRTSRSLTLSGSELGSPLVIDWLTGTVTASGRKVADFLTGDTEYVGQRKKLPRPTAPGISPGFQFINKTDWPVLVKIGQVGCLYHGVVPPQSTMTRDTGAVWFSLSASWATDGKDLTQEQVFTDCAAPVLFTTLGVIAAAATGGSATGVVALGLTSAATSGAAATAVQFMNASGASQLAQDATAAGIFVVAAAVSGGVGAFQVASTKLAPGMTAAAARSAMTATVAKGAAREALVSMRDEAINYALFSVPGQFLEPDDKAMKTLESWFDPEISLAGQYAGYPWPWKMKDRVMPQYEITGGPRIDTLKDGSKLIRKGSPFKFVRVN